MSRIAPFPFKATTEIKPYTFVNVDLEAGTCTPSTNLETTKGITVGDRTPSAGGLISVHSAKNVTESFLVRANGTIAKGATVASDANGLAVTTASGVFTALEAGVAGQIINVISTEAF